MVSEIMNISQLQTPIFQTLTVVLMPAMALLLVIQVDAMTIAVLTESQREAVEYVTERSRRESMAIYSTLKEKVISLGFTEADLKKLALLFNQE